MLNVQQISPFFIPGPDALIDTTVLWITLCYAPYTVLETINL